MTWFDSNGNSKMSFNDIKWMIEDVSKQNLDEMIKIYKSIGAKVVINGDLPKDDKKAFWYKWN